MIEPKASKHGDGPQPLDRETLSSVIPQDSTAYDVVVAGGGPAGLGASVGAALQGARTLLLEARSQFGGTATVSPWMPVNRLLLDGGTRGDVHTRFVDKVRAFGNPASRAGRENFIDGDGLHIHPDYLRLACFELLEEVGCHYRLYSPVSGVVMDGEAVTGVIVRDKRGARTFEVDVVVDATGDGDVAALAGAEMVEGREADGRHMPISLVFALANCNVERFLVYREAHGEAFEALLDEAEAEGYAVAAWYSFNPTTVPGVIGVNNGALRGIGNLDGTDPGDLTLAERVGIRVAVDFVRLVRAKGVPGLADCHLIRAGSAVGVRDTRRIVGEYVVTVEDARTGPDFDDVVARKYGAIDANQLYIGEMASGFGYPYRSMLPLGVENLLATGRCGSATFLGHAAGKSMGNMMALGHAAGVAAALSSRDGVTPRELPVDELQAALRAMHVPL